MLGLETAINRYLALDPEVLDKLAQFDGKVIKLEITGINKTLYLLPGHTGIQVLSEYSGNIDTVLRGSPAALFKMNWVSNTASMLLQGEIEISGDTRLGHQFKNVFSSIDIDWSEPLAKIMGDGLAFQLTQSGSQLARWAKQSVSSVSTSVSEYLQEESRDVVSEAELEIFNQAVDQLRDDVDRLQARISAVTHAANNTVTDAPHK